MKLSPARQRQHDFLQRILDVANGKVDFSHPEEAYQAFVLASALPETLCHDLRQRSKEYINQHALPYLSPLEVAQKFEMDLPDLRSGLSSMHEFEKRKEDAHAH